MDNISLESVFHWLSSETVKFEVDVGVCEKFAKYNNHCTKKSLFAACCRQRGDVMQHHGDDSVIVGCAPFWHGLVVCREI